MSALRGMCAGGIVGADTTIEVRGQGDDFDSILAVRVGDYDTGQVHLQGDPADVLAFVDRLRDAVIAESARCWSIPDPATVAVVS